MDEITLLKNGHTKFAIPRSCLMQSQIQTPCHVDISRIQHLEGMQQSAYQVNIIIQFRKTKIEDWGTLFTLNDLIW